MTDLSVIIVTWNCKQYVLNCLHSILGHSIGCSMSIIVVDNNSTDGTIEQLRKDFPTVALISNTINKGFAAANNQAILASSSRYVLLLNPDTRVHKDAFDQMVTFLNNNLQIAALGPSILNADGSEQFTGIRFPKNWNIFTETFYLDRLFPRSRLFAKHKSLFKDYTKPFSVDYVQGSCLLLRRSVLDTVGLLDDSYFMYFEETDLCYRIKNAGHQIYFYPEAKITHFGGGEEGHFTERRLLHYHQSLFKFYRKNYSSGALITLKFIIFTRSLIRILTWMGIFLMKPNLQTKSKSIIIGYSKTFAILFS